MPQIEPTEMPASMLEDPSSGSKPVSGEELFRNRACLYMQKLCLLVVPFHRGLTNDVVSGVGVRDVNSDRQILLLGSQHSLQNVKEAELVFLLSDGQEKHEKHAHSSAAGAQAVLEDLVRDHIQLLLVLALKSEQGAMTIIKSSSSAESQPVSASAHCTPGRSARRRRP